MRYAETGFNLEIDLSKGSIEREETDSGLAELYLGGMGTNAKILWDRVPPEVEPFSPDNLLVIGTGLLVGTPVPGANRTIVGTISPQTLLHAHSMAGGFWGPELKHAGYDKVIIRGKSPSWVYLWIHNDEVEIRDASHLLGKGPLETAALIRQELGEDNAQVATIGLAGENRVYMASIEFGKASASRAGVGAIMGDKKLKAIAVRGTKDVRVARPAELFDSCNDIMKRLHDYLDQPRPKDPPGWHGLNGWGLFPAMQDDDESFHINNFAWGNVRQRRKGYWSEEVEKRWGEITSGALDRLVSCYNCPMKCTGAISLPGRPTYFLKCSKYTYVIASMLDLDFAYRIFGVNHEYGLDGFSTPQVLAFAVELYEAGILTDKEMAGMPSDPEGRFLWLIDRIARREGIGDALANGTYWAARQIGHGAEAYAHNTIKKLEQLPIKLEMLNYVYYLMLSTGEKMTITQIQGSFPQMPLPTREEREEFVKDWVAVPNEKFKQYYLDWEPHAFPKIPNSIQAACDICDWNEAMHYLDDATGICAGLSSWRLKPPYDIHNLPLVVSSATGMDLDEASLWKIARRNRILVRAINVGRGLRREDEKPPEDHWKSRSPELEAKLLDEYYRLKGWTKDGIPSRETLAELGLGYVASELERRGILKHEDSETAQDRC